MRVASSAGPNEPNEQPGPSRDTRSNELSGGRNVPDAMTKYCSLKADLNMLSLVLLMSIAPPKTMALRIAAILSAFLSSLVRPLSALSALDPPLKPSR